MAAEDAATQAALNQLAQTATQGIPLIQFLLSPWFIIILAFVIIFTPLGIIGIISIYHKISNWSRSREGWIRVRKRMSNYHWYGFWSRPTGRQIKVKGEKGIELEIPFNIEVEEKDKDGLVLFGENGKPKKIVMMGMEKETDDAPGKNRDPATYPILGGKL